MNARRLIAAPRLWASYRLAPARAYKIAVKDRPNVRFSKADIRAATSHVRFTPNSGHTRCKKGCPLCANSGPAYSITSSAPMRIEGATVKPSSLAVLVLTTSSNFVACTTGKSAGFSPLRMRPTYRPA